MRCLAKTPTRTVKPHLGQLCTAVLKAIPSRELILRGSSGLALQRRMLDALLQQLDKKTVKNGPPRSLSSRRTFCRPD